MSNSTNSLKAFTITEKQKEPPVALSNYRRFKRDRKANNPSDFPLLLFPANSNWLVFIQSIYLRFERFLELRVVEASDFVDSPFQIRPKTKRTLKSHFYKPRKRAGGATWRPRMPRFSAPAFRLQQHLPRRFERGVDATYTETLELIRLNFSTYLLTVARSNSQPVFSTFLVLNNGHREPRSQSSSVEQL